MPDRKTLPGKFVWFEHVSRDPKKAQAFFGEVLGWSVRPFPMGTSSYDMIYAGETMIGGYPTPRGDRPSRWLSYVSVENVDAAASAASANGGKILQPPFDMPTVGRSALIADPQGAELALFKSVTGDPPDAPAAPPGTFFWNELHTTAPTEALEFYEKVVGFSHRSVDMGPGNTYHILSKGGVDRGGATAFLSKDAAPHWLPYVAVEDPDGTIARAKRFGGKIPMPPEDIPGVGRFGIFEDPTGAALAIMKPLPRQE
jgi:predicted enzyme related to lactoylglutathione lyase